MLSFATYLAAIRRDAGLLAAAADLGLDSPVPACPGWDVADLVAHTGVAYRHKTQIVRENWLEGSPDPVTAPGRGTLVSWFRAAADELVETLVGHEPAQPISTWDSDNETVGFWYRRMAHETFIHRIDAEQAHGIPRTPDPQLALDGIDELLVSFLGNPPEWASLRVSDNRILLIPTDADATWNVRLGALSGTSPSTGTTYTALPFAMLESAPVVTDTTAVVSGSADAIDLWLWGRSSIDLLAVEGHGDSARDLRALAAESTV